MLSRQNGQDRRGLYGLAVFARLTAAANPPPMAGMSALYWEFIADKLHREGWSWGKVGYVTRDGGVRHVVNTDDLLAGFLEIEATIAEHTESAE